MRKVIIKLNEKDYVDFLQTSNGDGLTAEEKIYEIINYYLIIERKKRKTKFSRKKIVQILLDSSLITKIVKERCGRKSK